MSLNINLSPGDNLYKYQLRRFIGGGNFGEVWLAHDVTVSKDVAIKILDESMAPVAENLKEAQVGHRLEHQNVVHVHYADVVQVGTNSIVLIAMDFHPNGSIVSQVNPSNFLSIIQAVKIIIDILRGLEYLHEQNLYHNDIKPSNILVGPRGEGVLTDYGISCIAMNLQPAPAPNAYVLHRAPETAINSHISIQTDIYQVGLTLFRLINGIGLIRDLKDKLGEDAFEELKAKNKIPRAKDYQPFVPQSIKRVITKATKSNPNERYQSALEMRRALESIALHGYWSTDATGAYVGYFDKYTFHYERLKSPNGFKFSPSRIRLETGRANKIARMSGTRLSEKECNNLVKEFMLAVVSGDV